LSQDIPRVSIVVLNWNGLQHLQDCFHSLLNLDYPRDRFEILCGDNGSTDGSVAFLRSRFPGVRLVSLDRNYGFGEGNNRTARQARFEWLAFLNNDTRVHPDWLRQLVKPLEEQPRLACISSKMVNWDGSRLDFVGAGANFQGFGFQFDYDRTSSRHDHPRRILAPCGGAMLIRRDIFESIGGWDGDYFAFYEDLDLGWQLNLMGYDVWYTPDALVYHRHHGAQRRLRAEPVRALYERNALFTMYKCLDDENLAAALPAALLLLNEKALEMGEVDREPFRPLSYRLPTLGGSAQATPGTALGLRTKVGRVIRERGPWAVPSLAIRFVGRRLGRGLRSARKQVLRRPAIAPITMSHYIALSEFAHSLEILQAKRQAVQSRRKRSDDELLPLFYFALEPSFHQARYVEFHRWLCRVLRLEDRFAAGQLHTAADIEKRP
jgi:GT2 family glycosyltransferase